MSSGEDVFSAILGFLIFVVLPISLCVNSNKKKRINENNRKNRNDRRYDFISTNEITITKRCRYLNYDKDIDTEFILDSEHQTILASNSTGTYTIIPFSEIIGCETYIDNQVSGGVGRAITGGILVGEVGAIVGAVTAKKKVTSYKLIIYRNNIQEPNYTYDLIKKAADIQLENDYNCEKAQQFSQKVISYIKAIIAQNGDKQKIEQTEKSVKNKPEDRIKSLDRLLKKGLITEQEYKEKREKILSEI